MANPEACGLWIEQRSEELRGKGLNDEEIGRRVSGEVFRYFETKIKSGTIGQKSRRDRKKKQFTNVNSNESPTNSNTKPKLEKLEKSQHGGARPGAGRKPKENNMRTCSTEGCTRPVAMGENGKPRYLEKSKNHGLCTTCISRETRRARRANATWYKTIYPSFELRMRQYMRETKRSESQAVERMRKESGIPVSVLKSWWIEIKQERIKNA